MKLLWGMVAIAAALPGSAYAGRRDVSPPTPRPAYCDPSYRSKVFFTPNHAELYGNAAGQIVDLVVQRIGTCRPKRVLIAGYIDRDELEPVARDRADSIKRALQARGIAVRLMQITVPGATDFRKPPPDVQNRRVEISFSY